MTILKNLGFLLLMFFAVVSCNDDKTLDLGVSYQDGIYNLNRPFNSVYKRLEVAGNEITIHEGSDNNPTPYTFKLEENGSTYRKDIFLLIGGDWEQLGQIHFTDQWLYLFVERFGIEVDIVFKRER